MNVIVITPPILQINSPYPSGAYLSAFFKNQGCNVTWADLNLQLFYSIFSSAGIQKIFQLSSKRAIQLAEKAEKKGDDGTAFNLRRYVSTASAWENWIDWIVQILRDGGENISNTNPRRSSREKQHQFLYSPFAPRGNRMLNFMENLNHEPTVDDVRMLCTLALADLSDYITIAFDENFSLVRYAESLAVDERDFSQIQSQLDSPVMKNFYEPVLENYFGRSGSKLPSGFCCKSSPSAPVFPPQSLTQESSQAGLYSDTQTMVCISIPFAGTLLPALYTARFFKKNYGDSIKICIGGGFVNTELRNANQKALAKYVDFISYDRGYGSYYQLLNFINKDSPDFSSVSEPIYKLRQFAKTEDGSIKVIEPIWKQDEIEKIEDSFTQTTTPDYSDIDFSIYPRVCDDVNPMHRLWTDGSWIKAYLAHGCYWHKCAFCDTQLDYVCSYLPVGTKNLYESLSNTAKEKGVFGIHFVDEALPPAMIKQFALENLKQPGENQLYYWGNVRFEKAFTKDLAALLSAGGFAAVSAGLEVATGSGLKNINKGTDIQSIVSACAAFKEAGILVHAYMIYGFWNDTPQSIIDSMETLRQFFEAGLLDSAFWHKFVLTRNSQVYTEWKEGLHPELKPIESVKKQNAENAMFAQNNLHFEGEQSYEKFGPYLETALNSWMHGEALNRKIQKWFDFPVPAPTIPKDFIEKCIEKYEGENEKRTVQNLQNTQKIFWLGSKPVISNNCLSWFYLQEEFSLQKNECSPIQLEELAEIIQKISPDLSVEEYENNLAEVKNNKNLQKILQKFHGQGLVIV